MFSVQQIVCTVQASYAFNLLLQHLNGHGLLVVGVSPAWPGLQRFMVCHRAQSLVQRSSILSKVARSFGDAVVYVDVCRNESLCWSCHLTVLRLWIE